MPLDRTQHAKFVKEFFPGCSVKIKSRQGGNPVFPLKVKLTHLLPILYRHELVIRDQTHRDPFPSTVTQFKFSSLEAKSAILFDCALIRITEI